MVEGCKFIVYWQCGPSTRRLIERKWRRQFTEHGSCSVLNRSKWLLTYSFKSGLCQNSILNNIWSEQWHYISQPFYVLFKQIINVLHLHIYFIFRCVCQCVFISGLDPAGHSGGVLECSIVSGLNIAGCQWSLQQLQWWCALCSDDVPVSDSCVLWAGSLLEMILH